MLLFLSITVILLVSVEAADDLSRLKFLKFSPNSYIQFTPDWSSLTSAISVCAWIRDIGSSPHRNFFYYFASGAEMTILADGQYIGIFGSHMHKQSSFTVAKGTWHHVCVTWSYNSRSHRYYVNGVLLGSQTTASGRTFRTGGSLVVGKWYGTSSNHDFAGEMAYLNVYRKELSSSEVASMANAGMCLNIAAVDRNEAYKVIKWEDILKQTRTGSITDHNMLARCFKILEEEMEGKIRTALAEKEELSTRLNATILELEEVKEEKTKTEERLNATHAELEETAEELEELLASLNRTWDWDVFLTDQFVNETFTAENLKLIQSSWDKVAGKEHMGGGGCNPKKPKKTSPKFEICGSVRFFFCFFFGFFGFFRYFVVLFRFFRSELRQEISAIQKSCQQ